MPNTNERDALTAEDQIRAALAAKPTPGPWIVFNREHPHYLGGKHVEANIYCGWDHPQVKGPLPVVATSTGIGTERGAPGINFSFIREQDAAHIAACNPKAIAALLATIDDLRAATAPNAGAPLPDAAQLGRDVARWSAGEFTGFRGDTGQPEQRVNVSVERLGYAVEAILKEHLAAAPAQQAGAPLPLAPSDAAKRAIDALVESGWKWDGEVLVAPNTEPVTASLTSEKIAQLRDRHGITSTGRGIRAFDQVAEFVRAVLKAATPPQATLPASETAGLTDDQREEVLDVLRNTHGMEGDLEQIVSVVADVLAGIPLFTRAQPQADAAEPVAKKPAHTNSCRMADGHCSACGGDWSVCGCQRMFDRMAATQAPSAAKKEGQP